MLCLGIRSSVIKKQFMTCLLHTNNHSRWKFSRNKYGMLKSWVNFTFSKPKYNSIYQNSGHSVNPLKKEQSALVINLWIRKPEFCLIDLEHFLILCTLFAYRKIWGNYPSLLTRLTKDILLSQKILQIISENAIKLYKILIAWM